MFVVFFDNLKETIEHTWNNEQNDNLHRKSVLQKGW